MREAEPIEETALARFMSALRRSPKGLTGFVLLLLVVLIAILAPLIAPHDATRQVVDWRFLPPMWEAKGRAAHLLGGDDLGRDIFSRVVLGARVSIVVALIVVALAMTIGSILGAIAGYFGGIIDTIVTRLIEFQLAFPFLLLALMFMAVLGPGFFTLVTALTVALWVSFARVVRGEAMKIRQLEYIDASRSIGAPTWRIILGHVLPNVFPSIVVLATLDVALVITAEAALSFLGLGVQPPTPSWGMMISDGRDFLYEAPWIVLGPGLAILLTSVGVNLFGDFLRDTYDPRLERS